MKLPKILSLKCNHAKIAAFKIDWSNWVVCYCSKHNYDCFSGLKIAVLLHSFKCFFNVGKQILMWIWMSFPWFGGRRLCQVGCLWKLTTIIYRRHCCLQTLFLLFKYVMSETKESCYKNQCASAGTLISSIAIDFFTDTAAILN